MYFDCHTHHAVKEDVTAIRQGVDSCGIHPWDITAECIDSLIVEFDKKVADKLFITIGECGLDKLCEAPYELQKRAFVHQIEVSEHLHMPLILHCVKAVDDCLQLRKAMKAQQPWIFHGFRGKPQQMEQLIRAGMYVSFGVRYNADSLLSCPLDRLFLETDDADIPIQNLYTEVSSLRGMSEEAIKTAIKFNYLTVFR